MSIFFAIEFKCQYIHFRPRVTAFLRSRPVLHRATPAFDDFKKRLETLRSMNVSRVGGDRSLRPKIVNGTDLEVIVAATLNWILQPY